MNRFTYSDIIRDILNGLRYWRVWSAIAWNAIKMEYRRTVLGPFWIALQHTLFILTLGYVFAGIQQEDYFSFFVYYATGYTFWILIFSFVTSAGNTFLGINGLPHMTRDAFSNHIYLQFTAQMMRFAHILVPLLFILLFFRDRISVNVPLLLCGFLMLLVFGFWVSILLGCLSLRFQDLVPAVTSIMQVMFFVTPVIFKTSRLPGAEKISLFNPFYHLLIVVRGNIIQEEVALINWGAVLVINGIGIGIALYVLRWARPKIAYWVG